MSDQHSKQHLLKSTSILGSVQILNILIGIVRIKILAILLGPVGVGVAGIYQTTISIISSSTGLGINFSGVREIAAANATEDKGRLSKAVEILKRWSFATGLLGMLIALIFCKPLSRLSFGNESYAWGIAVLSIAVLFSALTGGKYALLQGLRKINQLAKANFIGSLIGLISAISIYFIWGLNGIVPALLFIFFSNQVVAWFYTRKVDIEKTDISISQTYKEGIGMARLGLFMVLTIIFNNGFLYLVRSFITHQGGLAAVGHFVAAWTISSMYTSAIFGAMASDYYPRLSGLLADNAAMKKLINDQSEIALLLMCPIIIGMISFIGLIVNIFYSKDFTATSEILNWQLLGDFIKVLGYPLGYVLIAKSKGKLVILTELLWNIFFLGLIFLGWDYYGIKISGIAFLVAYLLNVTIVFFLVKKTIDFKWSKNVKIYIAVFTPFLLLAFLTPWLLVKNSHQYILGLVLTVTSISFSWYHLKRYVDVQSIMKKIKTKLGYS